MTRYTRYTPAHHPVTKVERGLYGGWSVFRRCSCSRRFGGSWEEVAHGIESRSAARALARFYR